jgi:pantetheine-phosphate adenylyltransferase
MRTAVYPGSFDPVTNGHFDIIERAASMFDQLVTSVVVNPSKHCRFDVEERVQMLREVTAHLGNVRVDSFRGLTVDYCRTEKFAVVVRGLRTVSDFQTELQMAQMNYRLAGVDTAFLITNPQHDYSSSLVREIALMGGDVSSLVPPAALHRIQPPPDS